MNVIDIVNQISRVASLTINLQGIGSYEIHLFLQMIIMADELSTKDPFKFRIDASH